MTAVDETEREGLINLFETLASPYRTDTSYRLHRIECGKTATLLRADAAEIAALRKDAERLIECVPSSWLDPILTGPTAVIREQPWGCPEVERILHAIRERMREVMRTSPPDDQRGEGEKQ